MQKADVGNARNSDSAQIIQWQRELESDAVLVDWLATETGLSKRGLKEVLLKGAVQVKRNGAARKRVRRATFELRKGDTVYFNYDPAILALQPPQPALLFKCREYSLWFKPAGLLSQGNEWSDHCSLLRLAEQHLNIQQTYLVHRLDREASGIMLIAHTSHAAAKLSALWQNNQILKQYKVCVHGQAPEQGEINDPLDGKPARTLYKCERYDAVNHCSWLDVSIITGRKHQIRRHLSAQGLPVVGDPQYGDFSEKILNKKGLLLQAWVLEFNCPFSKTRKRFELPLEQLITTAQ
ncbi:MAG TPA: RluA family pseudouridine synthase [Pseudomonadales bacterium]|nr:RluA family pseudouridine synthase [Pseudomonadales bacterium]